MGFAVKVTLCPAHTGPAGTAVMFSVGVTFALTAMLITLLVAVAGLAHGSLLVTIQL